MPLCKKERKSLVNIELYVVDNLMIDNIAAINDTIVALKSKGLVLKIIERLQD